MVVSRHPSTLTAWHVCWQIISGDGTSTDGNLVINGIGETNSQKFMGLASAGSVRVAVYADGSATFAGQITAGADAFAIANTGSGLTTTGSVIARRSGTGSGFGLDIAKSLHFETSTIKADGSATFSWKCWRHDKLLVRFSLLQARLSTSSSQLYNY